MKLPNIYVIILLKYVKIISITTTREDSRNFSSEKP